MTMISASITSMLLDQTVSNVPTNKDISKSFIPHDQVPRSGVNIFQNKWIFHSGKVSCFEYFREEFPYFLMSFQAGKFSLP